MATEDFQPDPGPPLQILAVCGSLNEKSITKMALSVTLKGAEEYGADTRLITLRDYKLVFYGEVDEKDYPPDVFRLREEIKDADGIIFGTPEYHGSMSGGHTGAIQSLNTMRTIGRNMHFWVLPQEVSVADSSKTFNSDGAVTDPVIKQRLLNIGRQVVKFASLQRTVRNTDFMKLWEGLPTW